jgi:hypothetical protein
MPLDRPSGSRRPNSGDRTRSTSFSKDAVSPARPRAHRSGGRPMRRRGRGHDVPAARTRTKQPSAPNAELRTAVAVSAPATVRVDARATTT